MSLILYELCAANDLRFSPFCWRTRLALKHKGLEYETVPVKFTEKHKINFSEQDKVPVINDDGTVVIDSWTIAEYLEDTYDDQPELFPRLRGRQYAKMANDWMNGLNPLILRCITLDIFNKLDPSDQAYFRPSREARFSMTLEEVQASREDTRQQLCNSMASMRAHLMDGPFVSGVAPAYSDFIVFGSLRWAELGSEYKLFDDGDPISEWYKRVAEHMSVE